MPHPEHWNPQAHTATVPRHEIMERAWERDVAGPAAGNPSATNEDNR